MLTTNDIILIGIIAVVCAAAIVLIKLVTKSKAKKDPVKEEKKIKTLERVYGILLTWRPTRNYFIRETKKYGLLSVFTQSEIKCFIVKNFRNTIYGTVLTIVTSAILFREVSAVLLCAYGAFTVFSVRADKEIEKATTRVYSEVKTFISSLRIEFKKSKGDILSALENAQCGARIAGTIDSIKQVLVSPNSAEKLEKFYQDTPFKQLQTLAMVCSNIYAHGDTSVGGETSVFDETMLLMESDINQKLEEIHYEKQLYKISVPIFDELEWLTALGVILTIVLKALMIKIMPSTEAVYNSIVGLFIQDAVIAFSIYAYNTVSRAHLQQVILPDDRNPMAVDLLKYPWICRFVKAMAPREQKRRILDYYLKVSVSKNTAETYTCERCLMAFIGFVSIFALTMTAPSLEMRFLKNYTKSFDLMSDNSAYEDKDGNPLYEKEQILEMDNWYIEQRREGRWENMDEYDTAEITDLIKSYMPTIKTVQLEDQMKRLEDKYQRIRKVGYRWWYVLFAFAAGGGMFFLPWFNLKKRLELALFEEEEEFLQLQMVTLILSSLNMDTFDTLGHLANIADFHKAELTQCYYGYASDPEGELQALEDSVRSQNFKLFVGKLKETIENLSVKEVFADLRNDRAHICNERDTLIKGNISARRGKMGRLSLQPMNLAIYGMMVFPLLYVGLTGLIGMTSSIQEM